MTITQGTKITDGTTQFIVDDITDGIPVGDVVFRPYLKDGYLACNGQEVNRSDYPRLIALADKYSLWTADQSSEPWKFGQGNGSTTMTMPNYKDRVLQGGDTAEKKEAGLPNIEGELGLWYWHIQNCSGSFEYNTNNIGTVPRGSNSTSQGSASTLFKASKSNPIYGSSTTVQPPAIVLIPQMKY